jgi:transaldolase
MPETKVTELNRFGQSVWLDNINRRMIETGRLKEWIGLGLRGMTSNPSIFDNAISKSSDYDEEIESLSRSGKSAFEIYDELTVKDIQDAADMYRAVYEESEGLDGYVSLEVNPKLARKAKETIDEALRLYQKVDRPNVMFKVPSTPEGFGAVEDLIASGVNVNITLIFSLEQYVNTASAYIRGMKRWIAAAGDPRAVGSVASVFISRIDSLVDKILEDGAAKAEDPGKKSKFESLKGKAAVANSALIYKKYLDILASDEFTGLKAQGVRPQRVLWGSTSTKNPAYSDIKYVTELIAVGTVNTLPDKTFEAFLDHGDVREALASNVGEAEKVIGDLADIGIDINQVCADLLDDGVIKFEKSFDSLLDSIKTKMVTS